MINDLVRKVETTKIPPQIPLEMDLDEFLPLSEGLGSGPIEFDYKGRSVMIGPETLSGANLPLDI